MKTATIASPLLTSDNMESSVMGMDAVGMDLATYFMRDKIYSDKIRAVVREYLCNAIDEHNKFDIKAPVQTGIRTENKENIFYVRDFANGLNEGDVRSIFGMYFRSTKSKSNDSIGGFGVGSKAGHCYNDTFFVTSYFQKKKTVYTCVLGGGDNGVPVGHIYKIDESSCEETGLEICVPVKQLDLYAFELQIREFIALSPANIQASIGNEIITPNKLVKSFESDGINFRLMDSGSTKRASYFVVQMGGVVYSLINAKNFKAIANTVLVVDVPIGKMSIPISRESFEGTASNQNFLTKIETAIEEFAQKDLAKFKTKNAREFLEDDLADLSNPYYEGDYFASKKSNLFSDIYTAMSNTQKVHNSNPIFRKEGKPVLLTYPLLGKASYWKDKIENHCRRTGENYYAVHANDLYSEEIDINKIQECFTVLSVKKVKYIKQSIGAYRFYTVYDSNGQRLPNEMNALSLHNYRRKRLSLSEASTEEEAVAQNKEYFDGCKSYGDFLLFSISIKEGHPNCYKSNSKAFIEEMVKLGWMDYNSEELKTIKENFYKISEQKRQKLQILRDAVKNWVKLSPRTKEAIKKDKNAMRMNIFWKKIEKESSLRSKIIFSLNNQYHAENNKYSREEFRTIMKLK